MSLDILNGKTLTGVCIDKDAGVVLIADDDLYVIDSNAELAEMIDVEKVIGGVILDAGTVWNSTNDENGEYTLITVGIKTTRGFARLELYRVSKDYDGATFRVEVIQDSVVREIGRQAVLLDNAQTEIRRLRKKLDKAEHDCERYRKRLKEYEEIRRLIK